MCLRIRIRSISIAAAVLGSAIAMVAHSAEPRSSAGSGWRSLEGMPAPNWDGKTLSFHSDQGNLAITPISDDIIRVRFTTARTFGRDHSYAIIYQNTGAAAAKAEINSDATTLKTASLKAIVRHNPLRIEFQTAAGESLD